MRERILKKSTPYVYVFLPCIIMLATIIIPTFETIRLSFVNASFISPGMDAPFAAFKNYAAVISNGLFWQSFRITVIWTVLSVAFQFLLGLYMALLLNSRDNILSKVGRSLFLIPWMLPGALASIIWKLIYDGTGGLLNFVLIHMHIISSPHAWLSAPATVLIAATVVNIWRGAPFFMIMLYGGLQTISKDMYEAATIDRANAVQRFFYITLPELKPLIVTIVIYQTIGAYNYIDIITALTAGGPANHTLILSLYAWQQAFANNEVSTASTISILSCLTLAMLILAVFGIYLIISKIMKYHKYRRLEGVLTHEANA